MTLLELLIAVAVTVVAGLALTTVLTTMARNITSSAGSRSALQRAHAAYVRLRAFTDPGLCLLQHSPGVGFAVWLDDSKASTTVNLREMRAFWLDDTDRIITVERVEFPEAWPPELQDDSDVALSNGADFLGEMLAQRALGYTKTEVLCDGVLAAALAHDAGTEQSAETFRLTLTMDDGTEEPPSVLTVHSFPSHTEPR
jgi:type II secretory pathway pseudopilin PulG